jgi:excisionase family DNA binding protein
MPDTPDKAPDNSEPKPDAVAQTANSKLITDAIANTEAAFNELTGALNAEAKAHSLIGGHVFYRGTYDKSLPVFEMAGKIGQLRDHIEFLHSKWKNYDLALLGRLKVQDPQPRPAEPASQPLLFRKIKGMPVGEAAKMLGVKPAMILPWLESGMLKGYRKLGGHWKIPQIELVAFSKKYPDLVGKSK